MPRKAGVSASIRQADINRAKPTSVRGHNRTNERGRQRRRPGTSVPYSEAAQIEQDRGYPSDNKVRKDYLKSDATPTHVVTITSFKKAAK
jgi:hypothetical protein